MRLCLLAPDIPQNAGTLIRLAACLGLPLDLIEPLGFVLDDRRLARAGLDYRARAEVRRHASWAAYAAAVPGRRVLCEAREGCPYTRFAFAPGDVLVLGSETAGLPRQLLAEAAAVVHVPMRAGLRSVNVALAAAMIAGEALRQTGLFPAGDLEERA